MSGVHNPENRTARKRRSRFRFSGTPNILLDFTDGSQSSLRIPPSGIVPESGARQTQRDFEDLPATYDIGDNLERVLGDSTLEICSEDPDSHLPRSGEITFPALHEAFEEEPIERDERICTGDLDEAQEFNALAPLPATDSHLRIGNWRVLWGIIMTSGTGKLTKQQYHCMRIIADTF